MLQLLLVAMLQATPDAKALATDALAHLRKQQAEVLNYTFIDTEHDVTHGGIFPSHHTTTSETIALEGSQYTRRIQRDGKPLSGKSLEHEQELYEAALRERRSVSDVQESRKEIFQHKLPGVQDRLLTDFDIRIAGSESIDGFPCTVIVFEPSSSANPVATSRVQWWVDTATHEVRKELRTVLAQDGFALPGSTFMNHFTAVDGVLLPHDSRAELSFREPSLKDRKLRVRADHQMSNYRRFRTTARIVPTTADAQAVTPTQP